MEMSKAAILDLCKEHSLYRTPHINDRLYLNFRGFSRVANLEEYTGLKALFLEGNGLESLDGLPELPLLKCLCAPRPPARSDALQTRPAACRRLYALGAPARAPEA